MSKSYYYFAASLPMIEFGDPPPMSLKDFLQDCKRLLPDEDFRFIDELLSQNIYEPEFFENLISHSKGQITSKNKTFLAGVEFSRNFRNQIAWYRADKANKDPDEHIRGMRYADPYIVEVVQQAGKAANPLEEEMVLDRARWKFLDQLQSGHYYDLEYIIVYGLKLRILERHETFRSSKGQEKIDEIKVMDVSKIGAKGPSE